MRGELRAKRYADKRTNGVVGNNGKNAPIMPRAKLTKPKNDKNIFIGLKQSFMCIVQHSSQEEISIPNTFKNKFND